MKNPPTTFKQNGQTITVSSAEQGRTLTEKQKQVCSLSLAKRHRTHHNAIQAIIAHGFANDAAEADELIYQAEELESQNRS